jgi:hypothetical protein
MNNKKAINGILLIYNHPLRHDAPTILEHVDAFPRYSRFKVWTINTEGGFRRGLQDLRFRIVLLHYSLFGYWPYLQLNKRFLHYLANDKMSYKIAFFQDEYRFCQPRFDFINYFGIDCIYTLIEPAYFKDVYQKYSRAKSLIYTIPGYVSVDLIDRANRLYKPDEDRRIDIGYRSRRLEYYAGKGGQEKTEIALLFSEWSRNLDLRLDIETEESQRIYGENWYKFIAECRGVLGVEAGVSIFDTEDRVRKEYERMLADNPALCFEEISNRLLCQWEGNVYYRTISPRHFEAAAFRVCQILFEGKYSGILRPMVHYIPLKKDFSNFAEVIRLFEDKNVRQQLTENAYRDLVASGRYSYQNFITGFDQHLIDKGFNPEINKRHMEEISKTLAKGMLYSKLRTFMKAIRYYPFPGKAILTNPLKPLIKKYRYYRRGKLENNRRTYRSGGDL